jgi:hypothetical protein
MKYLLMSFLVVFSIVSMAHAEETETDCPQMREQSDRSNPKAALVNETKKPNQESVASDQ